MALENTVQELLDNGDSFMVTGGEVFVIIECEVRDRFDGEIAWTVFTIEEQ